MDLRTLLDVLRRRIYVTIAVAVLTIGLTILAVLLGGRSYRAEGSVVIFPPTKAVQATEEKGGPGNPYLLLDNLAGARDLVLRALGSKAASDTYAEANPGTKFEAAPDYNSSGPIIVFKVTGDSPQAAADGLTSLIEQSQSQLSSLQTDLSLAEGSELQMRVIAADDAGVLVRSKIIRTAILAGAGVGMLGLLFIALIDATFARQRRRAAAAGRPPSGNPTPNRPPVPGSPTPNRPPASGSPTPNRPPASGNPTPNRPPASGNPTPNRHPAPVDPEVTRPRTLSTPIANRPAPPSPPPSTSRHAQGR